MTIFWLNGSSDSVMEPVQMYPHSPLAACSPNRLLRSPDLHRLHLCHESLNHEGRDGKIVYQPVVLYNLFRLHASPGGHKWIDLCVMTGFDNLL